MASTAPRFGLILRGNAVLGEALAPPRLQRAIGVIYRPETERQSHYFHARLPRQFDAVIHLDATRALMPLDRPRDVAALGSRAARDLSLGCLRRALFAPPGAARPASAKSVAAAPGRL